MAPLAECLAEMQRKCRSLEFKILRGTASEIGEHLKKGHAELAVAGPLEQTWDRLDQHPLYEEELALTVSPRHRLAGRKAVDVQELAEERILLHAACEFAAGIARQLEAHGIAAGKTLQIGSQHDLVALIDANLGVGFLPAGALRHKALACLSVEWPGSAPSDFALYRRRPTALDCGGSADQAAARPRLVAESAPSPAPPAAAPPAPSRSPSGFGSPGPRGAP